MKAILLDGKALAKTSEAQLLNRVTTLSQRLGYTPVLATVLVGDDPASATYVRMKVNACKRIGLGSKQLQLPAATDTETLLAHIRDLNDDPEVYGILLQHPVPSQIDERSCFDAITPAKDVDGVSSSGFGLMAMGESAWGSATPAGIMRLLRHYQIPLSGRRAVVVGRSPILGKPMAMMLLAANATVTVCHSRTVELPEIVHSAEILVAAVGRPRFIQRDWIRSGSVVIDAGFHPQEGCGDIDLSGIEQQASAYTPVPGGVGPMTINTLIAQTVAAAEGLPPGPLD